MRDLFQDPHRHERRAAGWQPAQPVARQHHPDFDKLNLRGWKAAEKEGTLPTAAWEK